MSTGYRRGLAAVASVVVAVLALAGPAAHAQSTAPSDDEPVILRVGLSSDLTTDNVFAVSAGSDYTVATTEYDMLQKFAVADGTAAPSLATGCDHNEDYTQWTCTLRDGLLWSDGTPLTSEDVAFSYRFVIDNRIPQYKSYFPGNPVFTTPDPLTFVWTADEPTFAPTMPPWVYIVPEHVWSQYDGQSPEGHPCRLRYEPGGQRTVHAHRLGARPGLDDGSQPELLGTRADRRSRGLSRLHEPGGDDPGAEEQRDRHRRRPEAGADQLGVQRVEHHGPEGRVGLVVEPRVQFRWPERQRAPVAGAARSDRPHRDRDGDRQERDRQQGVPRGGDARATRSSGPRRRSGISTSRRIRSSRSIRRARTPCWTTPATRIRTETAFGRIPRAASRSSCRCRPPPDTTGAVEAGELIVGYLKQIGIKVDLLPSSDTKMNDYWGAGNFDAYIWYWSGDPDPNYQLFVFTSDQCGSWSDGCWKDAAVRQAVRGAAQRSWTRPKRLKVVQEAQRTSTTRCRASCWPIPNWLEAYRNDQFTGWMPAPGPRTDTCCPATTTTRCVAVNRWPARRRRGSTSVPGLGLADRRARRWWGSSCFVVRRGRRARARRGVAERRMGSRRYLLSKALQAVVTLLFVLTFNFFLFRILPGDPVALLARSERLTPDGHRAAATRCWASTSRCLQQYVDYMRRRCTGDLGRVAAHGAAPSSKDMMRRPAVAHGPARGARHAPRQRFGVADRDQGRMAAGEPVRHHLAVRLACPVLDAGGLARHAAAAAVLGLSSDGSRRAATRPEGSPAWRGSSTSSTTCSCRCSR